MSFFFCSDLKCVRGLYNFYLRYLILTVCVSIVSTLLLQRRTDAEKKWTKHSFHPLIWVGALQTDMFLPVLWNPHLVTLKSTTSVFWCFWAMFGQKLLQNAETGSCGFQHYQMWLFIKITKSWLFYWGFWRFWAIFGKTTSGSSPKHDILEVWQKHVCARCTFLNKNRTLWIGRPTR